MKIKNFLILVVLTFFFTGIPDVHSKAKEGPADLIKKADKCRKTFLQAAKKRKYSHNWIKCISLYEKVFSGYPRSDQAPWALYHCAGLYTGLYNYSGRSKDLNAALRLYSRIIKKYTNHRLADDAQYLTGEIYYKKKKDALRAYKEFLKVDKKFPRGDMRLKAGKRINELSIILKKTRPSPKTAKGTSGKTSKGSSGLLKKADECRKTLLKSDK